MMFDGIRKLLLLRLFWRVLKKGVKNGMFKSKKFWAAVVGALVVTVSTQLGLDPEKAKIIAEVIVGYIVGQGLADFGKHAKTP
jgi:hypothetical protein